MINLHAFIQDASITDFKYGQHDCVIFSMGWASLYSGHNMIHDIKGSYSTKLEGLTIHGNLQEKSRIRLYGAGFERVKVEDKKLNLINGDVVFLENGSLGICAGSQVVSLLEGSTGLAIYNLKHSKEAWRWVQQ